MTDMKPAEQDAIFFRFEEDFVETNIRCIPMIVRFKLDACGIKLKLAEWSRMTADERAHLACAACDQPDNVISYRTALFELIIRRTGNMPTIIPVPQNPAWARGDEIPYTVQEQLRLISRSFSLEQWQALSDLQRLPLLKLSYSGHENKNFPRALEEFGLTD